MNKSIYITSIFLLSTHVYAGDDCSYGEDSSNKSGIGKLGVSYDFRPNKGYNYEIGSSLSGTSNVVKVGEKIRISLNTSNIPSNAKPNYLWKDYCSGKIQSINSNCTEIDLSPLNSNKKDCLLQVEIQDGLGNMKLDEFSYKVEKKDDGNNKARIDVYLSSNQIKEGDSTTFTIGFNEKSDVDRTISLSTNSGLSLSQTTVTIPANSTVKKTVTITATDDNIVNGDRTETIIVSSSDASYPVTTNITIIDNDEAVDSKNNGIQLIPGVVFPNMTITPSSTTKVYKIDVQNKTNEYKYVTVKITRQPNQRTLLDNAEYQCSVGISAGRTETCSVTLRFNKKASSGYYNLRVTGTASGGANFTGDKTIYVTNTIKNRNYLVLYKAKATTEQKLGEILDHAPVVIQTHGDGDCRAVPYKLWLQHLQSGQKQIVSSGNANACQHEVSINNEMKTKLTKVGSYKFWAEIYPDVSDTNKADNKSREMTVTVGDTSKPDLTVASLSVPSTAKVNEFTSGLTVNIRNSGSKVSTATRMSVYISDNSSNGGKTGLSDKQIAFFAIPAISANTSKSFSSSFKATQVGNKWIYACISSTADESNKTNNCSASKPITISDTLKYPDLSVTHLLLGNPKVGQAKNVSMTIRNNGQEVSPATTISFYTSSNNIMDFNDQGLVSVSVPAIPSGGSKTVNTKVTFTETGNTWVFSCVRPVEKEQNRNNNCSSLEKIKVEETPPANNYPFSLILQSNFTIQRSGVIGDDLTWVIERNGTIMLQRNARNELEYKYYRNYLGGQFRVWLEKYINGRYEVVSNVVTYNVN